MGLVTHAIVVAVLSVGADTGLSLLPGFRKSAWFDEQVREQWVETGVRVIANAPLKFDRKKPTRLILFATPNGNTIEQTLGCGPAAGLDWHFDIQHIAAQVRKLRDQSPDENIVLVVTEAEGLSWPAWRKKYADSPGRVRKVIETVRGWVPADNLKVTLACHSGGAVFSSAISTVERRLPNRSNVSSSSMRTTATAMPTAMATSF